MQPASAAHAPMGERLEQVLKQLNIPKLKPKQAECIEARLAGKNVLGVMPTSYGKSLCFQVPTLVQGRRTLVISPLIALQEDQTRKLKKAGVKAFAYHSGLNDWQKAAVHYYFRNAPKDEAAFLYLSPELLLTEAFHNRFDGAGFTDLEVDETQCVSTWGDSFRPEYQRIAVAARRLKITSCGAYTATIDPKIEHDITVRLPLGEYVRVYEDPMRPNLILNVDKRVWVPGQPRPLQKHFRLMQLLRHPDFSGPAIVYYNSLKGAPALFAKFFAAKGFLAETGYTPHLFHSEMERGEKIAALKGFLEDPKPLVFATSAFGMGIDRADVRQVIHYSAAKTLIDYAQQFGRSGRDGLMSLCTTFWSGLESDESMQAKVEFEVPQVEYVEKLLARLRKRTANLEPKERAKYNLQSFVRAQTFLIENSDKIRHKPVAVRRFMRGMAILQSIGLVAETPEGIVAHELLAGTPRHDKLLELTKMHQRREIRERKRIEAFFGSEQPTQQLLWEMLAKEE